MLLEELRAIIAERKIKQKDIYTALGISQSYTSELLSGKKEMSIAQLEKLCDFLRIQCILVDNNRNER